MESAIMLAFAGIRKSRKQLVSQISILFFAAMLLNLGLLIAISFGGYFDEKADELNAAHLTMVFSDHSYDEKFNRFVQTHEDTVATQQDNVLLFNGKLKMPNSTLTITTVAMDYENMGGMSQVKLVGDSLPPDENSVYVPYVLQFSGGLQLGGTFTVALNEELYDTTSEKDYDFTVAGFTEDIMLGVTNVGAIGIHFPNAAYKKFTAQLPEYYKGTMISVQLTDKELSTALLDEISDTFDGEFGSSWGMSISIVKYARTITSNIVAAIIVAFAIIILVISVIVIRFRISNTIEEEMRNYGALKAVGYTSVQIIASIIMQFTLTAFAASVVGVAVSYAAVSVLSQMFAAQTGLNWTQGFDAAISSASLLSIVLITSLTGLLSSFRIKGMTPIFALRGGAAVGMLRKNILPLDISALPLTIALAIKTMFLNLKQNLLITLILASCSFAVVFGIVMGYNAPRDTFVKLMVGQFAEVYAQMNPKDDPHEILARILRMDGVENAVVCDWGEVIYEGQFLALTIMRNYDEILNNQTYTGRNPAHQNEVVISGMLGASKGKRIGDTIILSSGDRSDEFIITGFHQSSNNMGREAMLTTEGIRLLNPDYRERSVFVELEDNVDAKEFIAEMEQILGDKLLYTENFQELLNTQLASILAMINGMAVLICIITALVVAFILFLVVRTMIIRRKQDLGIQKALGFTTFQLMNQIAGSFVPVAVVGTVAGSIVAGMTMNTWIGLLFRSIGIMKAEFIIPIPIIAVICGLLCLLTYAVSMMVSIRIRKISAYSLITE